MRRGRGPRRQCWGESQPGTGKHCVLPEARGLPSPLLLQMLLWGAHWEPLAKGLDTKEGKDIASTTVCQGLTATRSQEDTGARKGLDIGRSPGALVPPAGGPPLALALPLQIPLPRWQGIQAFPFRAKEGRGSPATLGRILLKWRKEPRPGE